ncbi:nuclear transport factor 2 family protein [Sphingobacterium paramultivorum]|uniref:Nuclear transport factor 2 family protein n=1 Tax=Sphingobacterium paramultivorum TaxID=2886510 RepID=A0A7G5E476_9SPHI|nr:nuclear transport factor 2 family protein [Sphingobacterium paramultivorum]QMV68801.1 nuclear transport factor 2 family protein [Sphingobacterium paramultivorum]WSO12567.1 nuclear transport factor 2 family protein [Sphingobacterium paramultivorum]
MKTLVKTFAAAALIAVSTFAMAAEGPGAKATKANINLSTADLALEHYVAVTTEGESAGVEQLFTEDFNQKIQASNAQSNSRSEVVKSLKKQKGEKLNCTVSTDIIEESADYMVAKVTLKFENFTKTDLVTLERVGNDWKVSKSINSYK